VGKGRALGRHSQSGSRRDWKLGYSSVVRYADRKGGDVSVHRVPDPLQQRQHRAAPADAVQPHHAGAGGLEAVAGVLGCPPVPRLGLLVDRKRDHRRRAGVLDDIQRDQRLLAPGKRLPDYEVNAGFDSSADLFFEYRADGGTRVIVGREHVRVADVAREERASLVGNLLRKRERLAVHRLEEVFPPEYAELLAVRVIRERSTTSEPRGRTRGEGP
jgi:hypothetical protein